MKTIFDFDINPDEMEIFGLYPSNTKQDYLDRINYDKDQAYTDIGKLRLRRHEEFNKIISDMKMWEIDNFYEIQEKIKQIFLINEDL